MNETQEYILTKLLQNEDNQRFSDMKPKGLFENDLYNYHLKQLISKGLVEKTNDKYQLTIEGKKFIANYNALGESQNLIRLSVALIVVNKDFTKLLLHRRSRHPFYGDISGISGKVQKGELIVDACSRKLQEETGLTSNFKHIGVQRKIKKKNDELLEDVLYNIGLCINPSGSLVEKNEFGENFWAPLTEFKATVENNNDNPDTFIKTVESVVKSKGEIEFFYYDEIINISEY